MDSHITGNAAPFSNSMDDISKQHSSQFASSLKDLKNLREQLYSAAEYFESSYVKENHKHFLVEGSKDYVARALVHTVDHFGSMADKLKKFLDEKANEFSDTNIRFSSIQQIMLYQPNQSFCTKIAVHVLNMTSTNKIKVIVLFYYFLKKIGCVYFL
ncbi:protein ABIL4-like isoform X2 [Primulina tabacum]|uniref:protein ABIL4-like isoform X2 n=1 Tax=Primulina tabacum TaxID=48773 RepID=UPI003F59525E